MKKWISLAIAAISLFTLNACAPQNKTQKGALYGSAAGAATGAIAGQLIGRNTKSTLIGAAVGAAAGGAIGGGIGYAMDKQEEEYKRALAQSEAAAVRREGNLLAITLKGDLTFATNSARVQPGLYSELDRIAQVMVQYPNTKIRVEGHTDSVGSESYNQKLSERRANAVKNILIQRGVAPERIIAIGYGETMPVADNSTPEGKSRNRRVEIKIDPGTSGQS